MTAFNNCAAIVKECIVSVSWNIDSICNSLEYTTFPCVVEIIYFFIVSALKNCDCIQK